MSLGEEAAAALRRASPRMLLAVSAVLACWCAARALEWAWWRPRRLGTALRSQGLRGTAYRPVAGDEPLNARLNREARSRTLPLRCHDIVPRAMPLLHQLIKDNGEMFISWFGPVPRVTITKPDLVHQVLSNKFGHFEKFMFSHVLKMLHNGVSSQEGEKWAKHRRIINPAFHVEKLKHMLPAFAACCTELVDGWESLAARDDGPIEVDVLSEMQRLAGDVISRAAFGSSYLEGRKIFELQGEQAKLTVLVMNKIYFPGYLSLPTRTNRRRKQIAAEVEGILKGLIAKREEDLRTGQGTSDDLLGLLLESNMAHCRGRGGGLTTDEVIGECKLFYFAGTETTSALLTWTMVVLCMHPEWQHRAREEVLRVLGTSSTPDYDYLNRLRTVSMVLYEVLRLYTPVTAIHRRTYKPMELDGVRYPAGVMLTMPVLCIHHDRDIWGPDVHEFRPERFAEGISKATASGSPAPFFPFGGGPRVCIGQNFALLEAKMALAMILRRFSLELSPAYKHAPVPIGMLQPEHGAQIKLRRLH